MARSVGTDFLMNARFWVSASDISLNATVPEASFSGPEAGFSACSVPEGTTELVKYREGHYIYERVQLGLPTMTNITLSRGVAKKDSAFFDWWKRGAEGAGEVRTDLSIKHFHRDDALKGIGVPKFDPTRVAPAVTYLVHEALPSRNKPSSDLDATANEISIMELEVGYEWFEIIHDTSAQ